MMQSHTIVFTDPALADLQHIRAHIGQDNPAAANRVAVQIVAACDRLEYLPERGHPGLLAGTRELAALWPYVIVYRINPGQVDILRIWHGAQDR
jgi:toxin ParE1/3/4